MNKLLVLVDFDGVLHSYTGDWQGAHSVRQSPVRGAMLWLEAMLWDERFEIQVFSARNCQEGGIGAMRRWLRENGLTAAEVAAIGFPLEKPAAHMLIDDRAFCFRGLFPTPDEVADFRPWWK